MVTAVPNTAAGGGGAGHVGVPTTDAVPAPAPLTFHATTTHRYGTPSVRLVTNTAVSAVVYVLDGAPAAVTFTVYHATSGPPLGGGGSHNSASEPDGAGDTNTCGTAAGSTPGATTGITVWLSLDSGPQYSWLQQPTANAYGTPLVRPVRVTDVSGWCTVTSGVSAGKVRTVQLTMPAPPLSTGYDHATLALPLPAIAATSRGSDGVDRAVAHSGAVAAIWGVSTHALPLAAASHSCRSVA